MTEALAYTLVLAVLTTVVAFVAGGLAHIAYKFLLAGWGGV